MQYKTCKNKNMHVLIVNKTDNIIKYTNNSKYRAPANTKTGYFCIPKTMIKQQAHL